MIKLSKLNENVWVHVYWFI